jgi:trk system potassium uptake protein TrkH
VIALVWLLRLRIGGRQLLQSELAGPTEMERLTATIRETARRLWFLYLGLTIAMATVLAAIGWVGLDPAMSLFDAISHAFSGIAIGGFSTKNDSLAAFSAATQWATVCFIAIAGVNFLRLYRVFVQRQPRAVTRDEEFRLYAAVLAVGSILLLMFVGASAGSTGGSIKVVRHLLIGRILRRELDQTVHREIVQPVRLNGLPVDERALRTHPSATSRRES